MQINVNASWVETHEKLSVELSQLFGDENITLLPGGSIRLKVKNLDSGAVVKISEYLNVTKVEIARSGKFIHVYFSNKYGEI